MTGGGVST